MLTLDEIKGKIRHTYTLATCAIVVLMCGCFIWTQQYLTSTQLQPKIINIAGKQRMLSQRIAFLQTLLQQSQDPVERTELRNKLIARTSEFLRSHEVLVSRRALDGQFTPLSRELEKLYFAQGSAVDVKVLAYGESAMQLASAAKFNSEMRQPVSLKDASAILDVLDKAVKLFEVQLSDEISFNQKMLVVMWLVTLALLLALTYLLFSPLRQLVLDQFDRVQEARKDILHEREQTSKVLSSSEAFLATMSEQFKAPISGIIGILELIPNAPHRRDLLVRKAEDIGYRVMTLANNLTDSLPGNGPKDSASPEDFVLIRLLDDAYSHFVYQCQEKNLHYQIVNESTLPFWVNGYSDSLIRALKNILDNAVKFTPQGQITVYNRMAVTDGRRVIIIRVIDSGIGIRNSLLDNVFQRFTKVYEPDECFNGTGTGLYTAQRLVKQAGGTITASSKLHAGSEFTLTVPLDNPHHVSPPSARPDFSAHFALVYDQEITCLYLSWMIEKEGFTVDVYRSGADLLANQDKLRSYTGVITDYYMPGIDGIELVNYLNAMLGKHMPPTMMISASPQLANIVANSDIAAWQVFVKPIDRNRFSDSLHALAANKQVTHFEPEGHYVLVVEDDIISAEITAEMLENMGYVVSIAADGETALVKACEMDFDIILLDLYLPGMSGVEVAEILKERGCQSTLISVTASGYPSDRERALAAGMRYHLVKPVPYQELKSTLSLVFFK